jgi:hypothetical protein
MALQLGALRDALVEAGATPDKAAKAAEEVAGYEAQLGSIRTDLTVLKWMVATVVALLLPGLWLLLRIAGKVGAM